MSFAGRRRGNKVKKGVQFTLMVVGQSSSHTSSKAFLQTISLWLFVFLSLGASGTGRTTFVNTLCESEVLGHKVSDSPETAHVEEGIRIKPVNVGALQSLHNTSQFFRGSAFTFRAGGRWRSHCPDNCGHSRIWGQHRQ
jgi:septin family protein